MLIQQIESDRVHAGQLRNPFDLACRAPNFAAIRTERSCDRKTNARARACKKNFLHVFSKFPPSLGAISTSRFNLRVMRKHVPPGGTRFRASSPVSSLTAISR